MTRRQIQSNLKVRPELARLLKKARGAEPPLLTVIISPCLDVPRQWYAHCLDLDILTQGNSVPHALEMITEAIALCIADDLENGRDPLDRPPAPLEDWEELSGILAGSRYEHAEPFDTVVVLIPVSPGFSKPLDPRYRAV